MKMSMPAATRRFIAFGGALLASAAVVLALFAFGGTSQADSPHAGLNFWMEAVGESGCDTSAVVANPVTPPATPVPPDAVICFIDPGTTFVLNVNLDPLPSDIPGYEGLDVVIDYTGLTPVQDGSMSSWPPCVEGTGLEVGPIYDPPGSIAMGCLLFDPTGTPLAPSTYDGVIATNSFTCDQSGTISLRAGQGGTDVVETTGVVHDEGLGNDETLNITCGQAPTATSPAATSTTAAATATIAAPPTTGTGDDAGSGTPWAMISLLAAAAVAGLGAAAWRFARR
jgi:hypothetical protein